jgi:ribosome assembly protein 1
VALGIACGLGTVVRSKWSQLTGELISSVQEAFRSAFLDWSPRLMLAMYTCEIQATSKTLKKLTGRSSEKSINDQTLYCLLTLISLFGDDEF